MRVDNLAKSLFDRIQKDFKFSLKDRLRIVADEHMFRVNEDEGLWKQKKEGKHSYQVYFDNVFVSFVDSDMSEATAYLVTMKEILKLYKEKKIHWNTFLYDLDKPKAIKRKKVDPKGSGIEHKIITEVLNKEK